MCELPGTADLREKVNEKKAELATRKKKADAEKKEGGEMKAPGGSKRKAADDGGSAGPSRKRLYVEVEPRKKTRTAEEYEKEELTEGEYRAAVVRLLGQLVEEANGINRGVVLHNVLQQRSLAARERLAARGNLPAELWIYDGWVKGLFGLEKEWAEGETDEDEEDEEEGEEEDEEEDAEGDADEESGEVAEE